MFLYIDITNNNNLRKDNSSEIMCNSYPTVLRFILSKGTSSRLSAVATVEAACIFPVVIFLFMSIIWLMDLFYIHSEIGAVVNNAGNELVAYSYPYSLVVNGISSGELPETVAGIGWSEGYLKGKIRKLSVYGKVSNLTTLLSDINDEEIDIVVTYLVKPYLAIPGIKGVILTNHFYSKTFTGYSGKDCVNDEMVYITRSGVVYHTMLDCRALNVKPSVTSLDSLKEKRNESGSIYYPCTYCDSNGFSDQVYITPYGTRYHSSPECNQLEPDIYEVPLSEAGDRRLCKYCGKGGH